MSVKNSEHYFLAGGGEMGELIRAKDWSKTSLGNPDTWPQSLRTMVGVILDNPFGMYIAWGYEFTQLYNDGFRPILGSTKHPDALGISTRETFSEIWDTIGPMFDNVMNKKAVRFSDLMLILNRNGFDEECYFDFSYSPIRKDDGEVGGILVTVIETTEKQRATQALKESNARFVNNIMQAPVAMCIFRGKNHVVEIANEHMLELWGTQADKVMHKPIFEGLAEAKNQGLEILLEDVYTTGRKIVANERLVKLPRNGKIETTYINFVYEALKETDGTISGIVAIAIEVTAQVLSRAKVEESEQKVRALVENAPFPIAVYVGKEMCIELANQSIIDIWGKGNDVIGKSFKDILPELDNQLVFEQINSVLATGQPFHTKNTPLDLIVDGKLGTYYFNYSFTPLYDINGNIYGVMNTGVDLTDLNIVRKKIEESEQNLRSMVLQSPIGICVLDAATLVSEIVNDSFIEVAGKPYEEIAGKYYWEPFAEARAYYETALNDVVEKGISFYANEVEMMLIRHGKEEIIFVTFVYAPLKNIEGEVSKVIVWVLDNTQQVIARQKIEEADKRFRNTVKQAPVGITILRGPEYIVEMANEAYLKLVGREELTFVDRPLFDSLPEVKEVVGSLLDGVLNTGIPYHGNEVPVPINRYGKQEISYFDFLYHPLKEVDGKISGIIVTVTEVSENVEARKRTEQNEERLNIVVEASELGTWELNVKTRVPKYSKRYLEILGGYTDDVELTHEQLLAHLHPDDMHIRTKAFKEALTSGFLNYEARLIWTDQSIHWMEGKGKVFYDADHIPQKLIGTIRDITKEKKHQQKLEESEKQFRSLAESLPQLIWETDEKGKMLFASGKWKEYTGIKPDGEAEWKSVIHPDDFEGNTTSWMHSLATGDVYKYDVRIKSKEGNYRWHTVIGEPVFDKENKIQKWVGAFTDIHTEKAFTQELEEQVVQRTQELSLINESLKKSEERYHLMVEEVQDYAILYINHLGIIENWNMGAERIKGYKAEEILGKNFSVFYTESDQKDNLPQQLLHIAKQTGKAVHEGWRVRKNGGLFWANVVITAIHNEKNEVIGFSKVTHDLTEKKKADDKLKINRLELEQKNVELEKMNKELQSFAYISSHDLQEPLRKIQTFATQIMEKESKNLSDYGKEKFLKMHNSAQRMQTLINDLLSYSRTNVQERVFEKTDINKIIEEVKEDLQEELTLKHAIIESDKIEKVKIIPFQFRQLIYNLISNSLKFSNPNVKPCIKIKSEIAKGETFNNSRLSDETSYCHIIISDNGIGFEQQYGEKIFEVFQRLHGKNEYTGTGIGLAIVKKIVENHNGIITAKGEHNKGATFDIYIPII